MKVFCSNDWLGLAWVFACFNITNRYQIGSNVDDESDVTRIIKEQTTMEGVKRINDDVIYLCLLFVCVP